MKVNRIFKDRERRMAPQTARQFTGDNFFEIARFVYRDEPDLLNDIFAAAEIHNSDAPVIATPYGEEMMKPGEWVIREPAGLYVCTDVEYNAICRLRQKMEQGRRTDRRWIPSFWCGMFFLASVLSLVEDYMGKDHYVEYVQRHWDSPWFTVPLALGLLALIVVCGRYGSKA